jgi:hypothetical protein
VLGIAVVVGVLIILAHRFGQLPSAKTLFFTAVIATLAIAFYIRSRIARTEPDYRQLARSIEANKPDLHALLVTAVEQQRDPQSGRMNYLQERVIRDALVEIQKQQQIETVPRRERVLTGLAHGAAFAAFVAMLFFKPTTAPGTATSPLALTKANSVSVTPGDANIERGSALVVLARFEGQIRRKQRSLSARTAARRLIVGRSQRISTTPCSARAFLTSTRG